MKPLLYTLALSYTTQQPLMQRDTLPTLGEYFQERSSLSQKIQLKIGDYRLSPNIIDSPRSNFFPIKTTFPLREFWNNSSVTLEVFTLSYDTLTLQTSQLPEQTGVIGLELKVEW
jgi:hypothetical protein